MCQAPFWTLGDSNKQNRPKPLPWPVADSLMRIQKINPYTTSYRTECELGKGPVKKNKNRARGQRMAEVLLLQLGGQARLTEA